MNFEAFVGPSYTSQALNFDAQRAMNLYIETDESKTGKAPRAFMGTPGLNLLLTLPTAPIRGIWTGLIDTLPGGSASDLMYVVAGSRLYSISSAWTYTDLGDVGNDSASSPVQFAVNGGQLLISSAGSLWLLQGTLSRPFFNAGSGLVNTSGTAATYVSGSPFDASQVGSWIRIAGVSYQISAFIDEEHVTLASSAGTQANAQFYILTAGSLPIYVNAAQIAFLDTYFIAVPANSKVYYISAINDGSDWNALDFGSKSAWPDAIAGILVDHEELWVLGTEKTEVHRNTGDANFPFQRDPGSFVHQGSAAPFAAVSLANGVAWIGGDERGGPIAWYAQGYVPQRISTHAIETAWRRYKKTSKISDAVGFVYVEDGHQFWVISFPSANATWVYDATAQEWHERGAWNSSTNQIDRARYVTHGSVYGKHVVGDWYGGQLYELSLDAFTDAGTAIHRIRTAPHLSDEELWTFYSRFRLAMAAGPTPTLAWSDDLGVTYNTPRSGSARRVSSSSDTATQMSEWRRLGRGRDRVFSVMINDAVQVCLTGAYLDLSSGGG